MAAFFLSVHVLVAIVFVGSVTVAASAFPRYARQAAAEITAAQNPAAQNIATPNAAAVLHRTTRVYSVAALTVPFFGIATAAHLHVLGEAWVQVSMGLTLVAGVLLAVWVVPGQRRVLAALPQGTAGLSRLAMVTGLFNLTWAVVVVLMILRPGSTALVQH